MQSSPIYGLFWRLYIVMGAISVAVGFYLFNVPGFGSNTLPIRIVAGILVVFGLVRIVNSVIRLRKIRQ